MLDQVDEVKDKLDIVSVVSQYVQLKKAGVNHKGPCPFHNEKTPSFVVSEEKQIFHCFGCHKGGDVFTFVQEIEGIGFSEALELLADRAGVKLDKNKEKKVSKDKKERFKELHEEACKFFEKQLFESDDGKKVLKYLEKRGVHAETIKEFRLGFCPVGYEEMNTYLVKLGYKADEMLEAGLVSKSKIGDDAVYDKYRGRLIFPIFDNLMKVCGFAGRALSKDQAPKYLNSPEHFLYNKSKILYGFSHCKEAIREESKVVLVEGYFDMILPYQAGIKFVVATSGTALTKDQVKLISRYAGTVVTSFDADNAGMEATRRSFPLLVGADLSVKSIKGLHTKDPADYVAEGGDFLKLVLEAPDFLENFIDNQSKKFDLNSADGRRGFLNAVLPFVYSLSPILVDHYVRYCSKKTGISEMIFSQEISAFNPRELHVKKEEVAYGEREKIGAEELFIAILLARPELFGDVSEKVQLDDFRDDVNRVYKAFLDQYNSPRNEFGNWNFKGEEFVDLKPKIDMLTILAQEKYGVFSDDALKNELDTLIKRFTLDKKRSRIQRLNSEIREAEEKKDMELLMKLLSELQSLQSNN